MSKVNKSRVESQEARKLQVVTVTVTVTVMVTVTVTVRLSQVPLAHSYRTSATA